VPFDFRRRAIELARTAVRRRHLSTRLSATSVMRLQSRPLLV